MCSPESPNCSESPAQERGRHHRRESTSTQVQYVVRQVSQDVEGWTENLSQGRIKFDSDEKETEQFQV